MQARNRLRPSQRRSPPKKPLPLEARTALLYDDWRGLTGASLHNRIPPRRTSTNPWLLTQGIVNLIGTGRIKTVHSAANPCGAIQDCGVADVMGSVSFKLPTTGSPTADIIVRSSDNTNYIRFFYQHSTTSLRMARVIGGVQQGPDATATVTGGLTLGEWHHFDFRVQGAYWEFSADDGTPLTYSGANATYNQTSTRFGPRGTQNVGEIGIEFGAFSLHAAADVVISQTGEAVVSRFTPGVQFVNTPDAGQKSSWNCDGWANARANLIPITGMYATRIFPGGLVNPWQWDGTGDLPEEPNNLYGEQSGGTVENPTNNSLAYALNLFQEMNEDAPKMVVMNGFEWWMKGRMQSNGTTIPCTYPDDRYTDEGRVMYSRMGEWYTLCYNVALLALGKGVRYFSFGSELQGYWNPKTAGNGGNKWDVQYSAGTAGDNADGGASYTYGIMCDAVLDAAVVLDIARSEVHLGGLYCIAGTRQDYSAGVTVGEGHPLYDKPWGFGDLDWCNAQEDFLDIVVEENLPLDFMCVDGRTWHVGGAAPTTEDWLNQTKWSDWLSYYDGLLTERGLDAGMEKVYPEFYCTFDLDLKGAPTSYDDATDQLARSALRAEAMRRMLLGGVSYACTWGPHASAWTPGTTANSALITSVAAEGGGQQGPAYAVVKAFFDNFAPGQHCYSYEIVGAGVSALFGELVVALINQTNAAKVVRLASQVTTTTLTPYEVKIVNL